MPKVSLKSAGRATSTEHNSLAKMKNGCFFLLSFISPLAPACKKAKNERAVPALLPVDPFVVVVGVEELDLLVSLWTGKVTRYGGVHEQEKIKCCRSWKKKA